MIVETKRLAVLDAMRGIAAIVVVFFHRRWLFPGQEWFYSGYLAVDFFFCLSGVVIAYAYDERLRTGMSIREFALQRLIRLYPMLFIGVTFAAALFAIHSVLVHESPFYCIWSIAAAFAVLPNPVSHTRQLFPINGPEWSLLFEFLINIIYASGIWRLRARAILLLIVGLFVLLAFAARGAELGTLGIYRGYFIGGFARAGFSFLAGVLIFRIGVRSPRFNSSMLAALIAIILLLVLMGPWSLDTTARQLFAVAIVFPLIVYFGYIAEVGTWQMVAAEILGAISYPLYTIHYPLLGLFDAAVARIGAASFSAMLIVPYVLILSAGSYILHRYYDEPVRRCLRRFAGRVETASLKETVNSSAIRK